MRNIITLLALFITTCGFSQSETKDTVNIFTIPKHTVFYIKSEQPLVHPIIITEDVIMKEQLKELKSQIEELKSQVKELSELLLTLLRK